MISAVIITYNEERIIARSIDSLKSVVDEVIVVDSFSTDRTIAICKEKGAVVLQNKFEGYKTQKHFAATMAKYQWILSIDADEVLSNELINSLLKWRKNYKYSSPPPSQPAGYFVSRRTDYCGKWVNYGGWYPDKKLRFFNRNLGQWSGRNVHEFVKIKEGFSTNSLKGDLLHYSINEPAELLRKLFTYSEMGARFMNKEGRSTSLIEAVYRSAFRWLRQTIFQLGFLDGMLGFKIAKQNTLATFWKYRRLDFMNKGEKNILILQNNCIDEAGIVANAIKWFNPNAVVQIKNYSEYVTPENEINSVISMSSQKKDIIINGLKQLHKFGYPAALRFPEEKDWALLS
ncbi:MAG: glycosyltransferase family 2 protein [Flavobacteriales bacterium]